ncbi:hypothetical protein FPZ43_13085 [Mucilaginibacter pallidiroseus]|uniref:Uncharacterized protein n=1 Tax=Mucilaginibacter pallidiroseus TaxID=2599295 RepID=A0A563U7T7_9SPHI|nr:hypothetical protein [Mucilaginibacter pallidiroseus]TWR27410.1 hypothetical protein FPZ43_13085 [Mucilaginibacter pallidiroseus]
MKSEMDNNEWADEEMSLKRFTKENPFTVPSGYFEDAGQRIIYTIKLSELKDATPGAGFTVADDYFEGLTANIQSRVNIEFANADVFTVPKGYFAELTDKIQSRINIEEQAPATEENFGVPNGYFESLSDNIQSRINIGEQISGEDAFNVPDGYFENLSANIQSRINIEEAAPSEEASFGVPQGYFENLSEQITAKIAVDELLNDQEKVNAFDVPAGYFDKLNAAILNKTVAQQAVVRKLTTRKLFALDAFKYATAACLALIVGFAVFFKPVTAPVVVQHNKTMLHTQLSDVPVDEIKDYLELHVDAGDAREMVDAKQINTQALDADIQDYVDF